MRITIEPTAEGVAGEYANPTIAMTHPTDDLSIHEMMQLVRAALIAFGYGTKSVNDYIEAQ